MASLKDGAKGELGAFKKFISRGNVIDMAVGVIIGGAFGKIVSSLVNDIVMPLIGKVMGGLNFSELSVTLTEADEANGVQEVLLNYGKFIQSIVDFFIIAICIFIVIRLFEKFKKKEEAKPEETPAIVKTDELICLEEIRDLLKASKKE